MLLYIPLKWFTCSNTQDFLYENTLKCYLVNEQETHLEPFWKQKLGLLSLMFATVSSLWKLSVNYILKSGDFPTFSKFFQCKRWFQEKLFTSIPPESSEHKNHKSYQQAFSFSSTFFDPLLREDQCQPSEGRSSGQMKQQHLLKLGFPI